MEEGLKPENNISTVLCGCFYAGGTGALYSVDNIIKKKTSTIEATSEDGS